MSETRHAFSRARLGDVAIYSYAALIILGLVRRALDRETDWLFWVIAGPLTVVLVCSAIAWIVLVARDTERRRRDLKARRPWIYALGAVAGMGAVAMLIAVLAAS